mgnify:FL=1
MENIEYKDWLKSLKPGDKFAIETITGSYVLRKVARLTKTQIVLDNCQKFYISSGLLVGGAHYRRTSIIPVTAEIKEVIERSKLIYNIKKSHLYDISTESLRQILSIIESETRP